VEITEVRIKLMEEAGERLQAFCSITFDDCFVIRDLKIIDGANGPFVAMPSRKLTSHCMQCGSKNHLRANYCNECGAKLNPNRAPLDEDGRAKLYADIAHPINSACREMIQDRIISEFYDEVERSKQPGYVSRYDDADLDYMPSRHARGSRSHPTTNYPPAGGGRGGKHQSSDRSPRAPHKLAATPQPVVAKQTESDVKPSIPSSADGSASTSGAPSDGFGAGIF
jgi:stage V sporulation protein G